MILYLDTSALLKKYFKETGSSDIISIWKKSDAIITSSVAYAETMATIFRKKRETNVDESIFMSVIKTFQKDWLTFITVEVKDDLNKLINKIVASHPLRGFDAVHLASALTLHDAIHDIMVFACYDKRLLKAAKGEGLQTLP